MSNSRTIRCYTQSMPEPMEIMDPGTRFTRVAELAWTTPVARTTVEGREVYVEIEPSPDPEVVSIRRSTRAMTWATTWERCFALKQAGVLL